MERQDINTILITVFSILAGWAFIIWHRRSGENKSAIEKQNERLSKLEMQQLETNVKITPLWARVQKTLSDDLHHPHKASKEMDDLLEKLEVLEITEEQTIRLKELLAKKAKDFSANVTDRERKTAEIMPIIMDMVLEEASKPGKLANVELVGHKESIELVGLKEEEEEKE